MKTVYIFLADGFEEIEAITPIDILRRAGATVITVGVTGPMVTGAHGVVVQADIDGKNFTLPQDAAMVVLPGGGVGTQNLASSPLIEEVLKEASAANMYIAAICAAPTVLHKYGLLQGKTATAFPDMQAELTTSKVTGGGVEVDGNIITARSAGVALQFAAQLAALVMGQQAAQQTIDSIYPEQ
ncbi:DJ-1/PfpI family protein [Ruminococcaceae bacterium OttesenSCG-928-A16]|nr:DJ-1/PfpI family protein [Ruminococcaceae bacterium OttesenSCG-928-A16]